ncbi:hypothetical protein IAQ61_003084 [Plenodomus lingam]|uniref:uncharacterized protein n=1 Tax=Leptosphaeria maculans TaxID=5022 RepID=UPI00331B437D|nr:hypothetical protein IAQ61_003084 [Plenodomus lingam]
MAEDSRRPIKWNLIGKLACANAGKAHILPPRNGFSHAITVTETPCQSAGDFAKSILPRSRLDWHSSTAAVQELEPRKPVKPVTCVLQSLTAYHCDWRLEPHEHHEHPSPSSSDTGAGPLSNSINVVK